MPKNPHAVKLGRKGGKKLLITHGRDHFVKAGIASGKARRKAKKTQQLQSVA